MVFFNYYNRKNFKKAKRVKLVSAVLKGPALKYWMKNVNDKMDYSELEALFRALEKHIVAPAHHNKIETLSSSMTMEDIMSKNSCGRVAALQILYHKNPV